MRPSNAGRAFVKVQCRKQVLTNTTTRRVSEDRSV